MPYSSKIIDFNPTKNHIDSIYAYKIKQIKRAGKGFNDERWSDDSTFQPPGFGNRLSTALSKQQEKKLPIVLIFYILKTTFIKFTFGETCSRKLDQQDYLS